MSDLAIAALSGAGVTVTVAIVVAILGIEISQAKDASANARVDATEKAGLLAISEANVATQTARADLAERKLRDLDALFNQARDAGHVDGAYDRLLQDYATARVGAGTSVVAGTVSVPAIASASQAGSSDLLKPGNS